MSSIFGVWGDAGPIFSYEIWVHSFIIFMHILKPPLTLALRPVLGREGENRGTISPQQVHTKPPNESQFMPFPKDLAALSHEWRRNFRHVSVGRRTFFSLEINLTCTFLSCFLCCWRSLPLVNQLDPPIFPRCLSVIEFGTSLPLQSKRLFGKCWYWYWDESFASPSNLYVFGSFIYAVPTRNMNTIHIVQLHVTAE